MVVIHNDSGLLATICDMVVRLIDIETRKIVRELEGFRGRVLDIVRFSQPLQLVPCFNLIICKMFSPDSRWLEVASLGSIVRAFDVPTTRLIDAFRTSSVARTISFSPTNDFLATAHVDSVGVYLWCALFHLLSIAAYLMSYEGQIEHNMPRYHSRVLLMIISRT